ncbi:GTP cyclohydrolase I FolE2 [Dissulfurirhabdus thermomarina]|uniref:GTP cyclohydrolase FolE2 n=1 Tax=Dissulfurirhabdus thermomarina TaxID=1765737 RepID=A0A6N9TM87_DISTH|nr:GTP cyclohydrolase FolE2 [Dissulfurirhabdus thermomarina]NDY42355.1 GTP cyclohydrolase I FolE2 [Dissulfurirhabdus thermomarina]NMX23017.1 GTP cyclohydrolase I FolE2 [Dissulfurirhabdus thermomarina]
MADVQSRRDDRHIPLSRVGIKNIRYPITVLDKANGTQQTVASINMYVNLPHHFKGTHMSRFVEILNRYRREINVRTLADILAEVKQRLEAEEAHLEVDFPYFIEKAAPVTGTPGLVEYRCGLHGTLCRTLDMRLVARVPINTVCPCSKEISDFGAHNQRGEVRVEVRFDQFLWLEDVIRVVEAASSSEVYSVLKRPDEKFVTEQGYEHPMFVEDVVRSACQGLRELPGVTWFSVEAENFESIHNHSAYAATEWRADYGCG